MSGTRTKPVEPTASDAASTPALSASAAARHPVVRALAAALRRRCGVREGEAVLIACSGGADSVALLRALAVLAPRRRWRLRLHVAHVQHHLRDTAERDARFVEQLAGQLLLPFTRLDLDLTGADRQVGSGNTERIARDARYRTLSVLAGELRVTHVATAHHADDQLETLLMRLLRGAAVHGWRGIPWRRPQDETNDSQLIRPLLGVSREALRDFLDELRQPWVKDETNTDLTRLRARLRAEVLPTLHALSLALPERLTDLTDHVRDLSALVAECASGHALPMSREAARAMNPAVLAEVLRRALLAAGVGGDRCTRMALRPVLGAARDNVGGVRRFAFGAAELWIDAERVWVERTKQAGPKR